MEQQRYIKVLSKQGKELSPCAEKIAWVLLSRKRAIKINDDCIQLIVDKDDLKRLKKQAIERDKRVCIYCGRYIPNDEKPTVDHLMPKHVFKDGTSGYDSLDNLACCCKQCNSHKGMKNFNNYCMLRISFIVALYSSRTRMSTKDVTDRLTKLI